MSPDVADNVMEDCFLKGQTQRRHGAISKQQTETDRWKVVAQGERGHSTARRNEGAVGVSLVVTY